MKTTGFFLITMFALVPAALHAQSAQTRARGDASATAQAAGPQARIDAALDAAARAEIPTSLLERKVAEGRAKQVPEDRIATAVESRLEMLVRAKSVLDGADVRAVSAGELAIAADALNAGVSESTLIRVSRDAPQERRAVATAVLTDLVRLGYESGSAFARVNAALAGGPSALTSLRAEAAASLRLRGGLGTGLELGN